MLWPYMPLWPLIFEGNIQFMQLEFTSKSVGLCPSIFKWFDIWQNIKPNQSFVKSIVPYDIGLDSRTLKTFCLCLENDRGKEISMFSFSAPISSFWKATCVKAGENVDKSDQRDARHPDLWEKKCLMSFFLPYQAPKILLGSYFQVCGGPFCLAREKKWSVIRMSAGRPPDVRIIWLRIGVGAG